MGVVTPLVYNLAVLRQWVAEETFSYLGTDGIAVGSVQLTGLQVRKDFQKFISSQIQITDFLSANSIQFFYIAESAEGSMQCIQVKCVPAYNAWLIRNSLATLCATANRIT